MREKVSRPRITYNKCLCVSKAIIHKKLDYHHLAIYKEEILNKIINDDTKAIKSTCMVFIGAVINTLMMDHTIARLLWRVEVACEFLHSSSM